MTKVSSGVSWRNPVDAARHLWFLAAEWGSPSASRLGVPCSSGICSCGLSEFPKMTVFGQPEELEQAISDMGMRSHGPDETLSRVESIRYCLRLLGRLPENEAQTLLAYYSGDRREFARLTGINNEQPAAIYVAFLVRKLALTEKTLHTR